MNMKPLKGHPTSARPRGSSAGTVPSDRGFSLLEMLVAMAVFLVVSAAAFTLFNQQQVASASQQGQVALNVGLRNAASQLQIDLANAGTGYYQGANVPSWPEGVTIVNNVVTGSASCYNAATFTYESNCFDTLNIIDVDPNTPPIHVDGNGTSCSSTTSSIVFGDPATGLTAAQTAAYFHSGDEILLVNASGSLFDAVVLTSDGSVSGSKIQLQHNPTGSNGTNSPSNDPLGITTNANNKLGTNFCSSDWILRLAPITYQVDSSNPSDPELTRTQSGSTAIVMEQVIGFKVGATIWNSSTDTVSTQYYYDASQYTNNTPGDQAYNYTLVRSVRVSLIGRTVPNVNPAYIFRNTFDQGPYQVQGIGVVVNPRNMSMND